MTLIDWNPVKLAVFDVDGTLYSQQKLRPMMARRLLGHSFAQRDTSAARILSAYRRWREHMAEQGVEGFEDRLAARLSLSFKRPQAEVRALVSEWIDRRPLPLLRRCRYPGVAELFAELRAAGRAIGVLSDYPAQAKLDALDLEADFVVSATDAGIEILKPASRGLNHLMTLAGVGAEDTVMIGDRADRDGEMGRRAGVTTYLRSTRQIAGYGCFRDFHQILPSAARSRVA